MAILHTLNKPPSHAALTSELTNALLSDDAVLLIEDGVYHALEIENPENSLFAKAAKIYVLKDDALCRGISTPSKAKLVTYDEFVKLSTEHHKVISWY